MPVIMTQQYRAGNGLTYNYIDFKKTDAVDNKAAAWYGFARIGLNSAGLRKNTGKVNQALFDTNQLVGIL